MFDELSLEQNKVQANAKRCVNTIGLLETKLAELYGCGSPLNSSERSSTHSEQSQPSSPTLDVNRNIPSTNLRKSNNSDKVGMDTKPHRFENLSKLRYEIENLSEEEREAELARELEEELDKQYAQMKALAVEKYDLAEAAFLWYESELRDFDQTCPEILTLGEEEFGEIFSTDEKYESFEKPQKKPTKGSKRGRPKLKKREKKLIRIQLESAANSNESQKVTQEQLGLNSAVSMPDFGAPSSYCLWKSEKPDNMIGCDAPHCKTEWYHYSCVGISQAPAESEKWYCPTCQLKVENLRNTQKHD